MRSFSIVPLLVIALSFFSITARAETPPYSYCAAPCAEYTWPSTWTGCVNGGCDGFCSPEIVEVITPCCEAADPIPPATKAACDAARCALIQTALNNYVACVNSYLTYQSDDPEFCCYGVTMIDCSDLWHCKLEFALAQSAANIGWLQCMPNSASRSPDLSLEETADAYLG